MFSPTDGSHAAGLNYLRIPIGASDFSSRDYSLDDTSGDTSFSSFDIPPMFCLCCGPTIISRFTWSRGRLCRPSWMKDSGSMNGGSLHSQYVNSYGNYLLKAVQGFQNQGFSVHAISIQVN